MGLEAWLCPAAGGQPSTWLSGYLPGLMSIGLPCGPVVTVALVLAGLPGCSLPGKSPGQIQDQPDGF